MFANIYKTVTIKTPINKPKGIFFCGSFTSPAIKVTLFQASLLKRAPINATPKALNKVVILKLELATVELKPDPLNGN